MFVVIKAKLDGIDTDETEYLEGLSRVVFINGECENFKVAVDTGELTRNINIKPTVKKNNWMRKTFGTVMVRFLKVPF